MLKSSFQVHDPFCTTFPPTFRRDVVVELLKGGEGALRRSDSVEAARQRGVTAVSDQLYAKVVKELCCSRGSLWSLKPGGSGL